MSDLNWAQPEQWARCDECGSEVWFDAYVDLMGRLVSSFDDNICTGECEGPVGRHWTVVDGSPEDETDSDDNEEGK